MAAVSRDADADRHVGARAASDAQSAVDLRSWATSSNRPPPSPTASCMSAAATAISSRWISPPGKLRWKYATGNLIGESSPAVGAGAVYVGDLAGIFHAVQHRGRQTAWTFKTGSEIKSSPVIVGDRC